MNLFKKRVPDPLAIDPSILASGVEANTRFALDLYGKIRSSGEENLFFSPYSLFTTLAMIYEGARGDTRSQIGEVLHFLPDDADDRAAFAALHKLFLQIDKKGMVQLQSANALWPGEDCTLEKEFLKQIKKEYGGKVSGVDFSDPEAARNLINDWVEKNTAGKITDLIGPGVLDQLTRLVLTNAIYFYGQWQNPFDPDRTVDAAFKPASGEPVNVPMMNIKHSFGYGESADVQLLELPYAGNDLAMLVVLPTQIDGLAQLEEHLDAETLKQWSSLLSITEVQVVLPRFEIHCPLRLDEMLRSLGMLDAFNDRADFSGISSHLELYVGAILHKAFLSVKEEGTEAAAATAVVMQTKSLPLLPLTFRADHPFLFLIREQSSGSILFMGRVTNPA